MARLTEPTNDVIRAEGLTKVFPGPLTAVDRLDMRVREGEIMGLLGPNGAGKTTTVGMLTTRVLATCGTAVVGGIDLLADPVAAKQLIGVVPQTNTLDRSLTVGENLYFHGRYFGMSAGAARRASGEMLERFGLAGRADARVGALSGGMAQRAMLARAILHRPAVLFCDEPTAGLDPQSRLALWGTLDELNAAGQTVLLTTHHMAEAERLCDRVAIMDRGRVLALDTPEGLKRSVRAGASVTVSADGDLDQLAEHLSRIEGASGAKRFDRTVRLRLDQPGGAAPKIVAAAQRGGFDLTDLSVEEATLETVLIALTGSDLRE